MLSIVCVGGGAQNSISPRATKGLEPALLSPMQQTAFTHLRGDMASCAGALADRPRLVLKK